MHLIHIPNTEILKRSIYVSVELTLISNQLQVVRMYELPTTKGVGIISGTERNDCVSFRILQEYDNLRNGTAERTVIGRNGTLIS